MPVAEDPGGLPDGHGNPLGPGAPAGTGRNPHRGGRIKAQARGELVEEREVLTRPGGSHSNSQGRVAVCSSGRDGQCFFLPLTRQGPGPLRPETRPLAHPSFGPSEVLIFSDPMVDLLSELGVELGEGGSPAGTGTG